LARSELFLSALVPSTVHRPASLALGALKVLKEPIQIALTPLKFVVKGTTNIISLAD
jgi:hypothetical protein